MLADTTVNSITSSQYLNYKL